MGRLHFRLLALVAALVVCSFGGSNHVVVGQSSISSEQFLPEPSDLYGSWEVTDEGERTKREVAEVVGSNGNELLTSWRWRENYFRDLARIDSASFPNDVTFINASVHRFANADGASEALGSLSEITASVQDLNDVAPPDVSDQSRALAGPGDGVNLYILYVRWGAYVLRLGGSSERGNPQAPIDALARRVLTQSDSATPIAPGPDIPVPIANGCWSSSDQIVSETSGMSFLIPPALVIDPSLEYSADLQTSLGVIQIELSPRTAPNEVNNFVCLAKAGFYDGTPFFRSIPGLLIQGGDPTGTGTGNPGYTFGAETVDVNYAAGVIAYANSSPDQNGSQFFIAVSDLNSLIATDFPVFGRVVDGMDVVEKIAESNVQATYASPATDQVGVVILESVKIVAHPPVAGPFITPSPAGTAVAASAQTPEAAGTIELEAKDIAFVPTELTINAADEPVTITMHNTGAALHDFSIDALDIQVSANPGETVDIVIPAGTAPGTYDFYCNVPGHKEAGMVGTLIVK